MLRAILSLKDKVFFLLCCAISVAPFSPYLGGILQILELFKRFALSEAEAVQVLD